MFITISPVVDVLKESLPPILGADSPFIPFSRMKPRIFPPCSSDFAQTMNTSAKGLFEIHILVPVMIYPLVVFVANVLIPLGSDPASGSVRPKQPIKSPDAKLGKYFFFCASEPYANIGYITKED